MLRFARLLVSALAFGHIIIAPAIAGAMIGLLLSMILPYDAGLVIGMVLTGLGLIFGFVWAVQVARRQNPADYISQVRSAASEEPKPTERGILISGNDRVDDLHRILARDEDADGDYWILLGNRLLLDELAKMNAIDQAYLQESFPLFSNRELAILAHALVPDGADPYENLLPFRSALFASILDHADKELFDELVEDVSFIALSSPHRPARLKRIRERLSKSENSAQSFDLVEQLLQQSVAAGFSEVDRKQEEICFDLERMRFEYRDSARVQTLFRAISNGSNIDTIVFRCGTDSAPEFRACMEAFPFHYRYRMRHQLVAENSMIALILRHPSINTSPSPAAELNDGADWMLFNAMDLVPVDPIVFPARLAIMSMMGGLYQAQELSAGKVKELSHQLSDWIIEGRSGDFLIYQTEGWSNYFGRIGYDRVFLLFDKGKGEFWVLAKTDYD